MKKIVLLAVLLLRSFIGFSQWEPLNGPYGGPINDLKQNDQYQFASTGNGLYRSDDNGSTWTRLLVGLGSSYSTGKIAIRQTQLVVFASSAISGESKNYLVKSIDNGNSWITIPRPDVLSWANIAINPFGIYICDNHLWVSSDEGQTWNYSSLSAGNGAELNQYDDQIYVGVYHTIYKSASDADEWSKIEVDGMTSSIHTFEKYDSVLFVRDEYERLLISDDGGESWRYSSSPSYWGYEVNFIKINDDFYGYRFGNILKSEDNGLTWDSTGTHSGISHMIVKGDTIIAGTSGQGIIRSADLGVSFNSLNLILTAADVEAIEVDQNYVWTACNFHGVSRQSKSTNAWDAILFPATLLLQDIKSVDGRIFVIRDRYDIFRSDDVGLSWSLITPTSNGPKYTEIYIDGQTIRAGGPSSSTISYLFKSTDYGNTWQPDTFLINNTTVWPSLWAKKESHVFTADRFNIYRSNNSGFSWEVLDDRYTPPNCTCVIIDLIASDSLIFVKQLDQKISMNFTSVSRDNGDTWEVLETEFPINYAYDEFKHITEVDNILIATGLTPGHGIYISRDQAVSWQYFDEGLLFEHVNEITYDDEYLYAATSGKGVFRRKISDLHTTSTYQPVSQNNISIYPNPSKGNFTLKLNDALSGNANVIISDANGRVYQKTKITLKPDTEIETKNLVPGFYLISLQTGDKIYTGMIIIQK